MGINPLEIWVAYPFSLRKEFPDTDYHKLIHGLNEIELTNFLG